jgi:tetratricopeptide (TPR) repeat protein
MAYEAITGRPPFTATSPMKLLAAHLAEAPEPIAALRPETTDALATLIHACLEKEPEKRPQSAADIVRQLDAITTGSGSTAVPSILVSGRGAFAKALVGYVLTTVVVAIVARTATVVIGLPDWVFTGSLIVMALGLPVILFTWYVHRTASRIVAMTPQFTPGGTLASRGTMQSLAMKASPHVSWRRTMLGGAYAIGAFIVLVGAFMLLRALGIGPAGSLLAAGRINAREPVVVTDFKVTNADTTLGRVLSDAAKTQLAQSSVITLLPADAVADALRRMTRPESSNLDFALARELAQRNGIRAIVDGEVTGLGGAGLILTMRLVTADSARELGSFHETASTAQGLIEAVDALARKLRGRVGESLKSVREAPKLERATTASFEALRKYTEGVRADERLGHTDEAIALLKEAVAIDSTFAEAWRKLGVVLNNNGRSAADRDAALEAAYRHRNRVPENVRHWIEGTYYTSGPARDRAKAAEAYEAALRNGDSTVDNNLANLLASRRQFARAESLYRARERRAPFRILYTNLAANQLRQAKFVAADSTIEKAGAVFPDLRPSLERIRIDALMRRGDTAAFRRIVDSMYTKGDSAAKSWALNRVFNLKLLDGQLSKWYQILAQLRPAPAASTPRQRLGWATARGDAWTAATWRRRPGDVEKRLDEAIAGYDGTLSANDFLNIAVVYAYAERGEKGRRFLARYQAEVKDTTLVRLLTPDFTAASAEVLVAEGKPLEAVNAFRKADRLPDGPASSCLSCLPSGLARAFDRAGVADSALKYYDLYLSKYDYERYNSDQWLVAQFNRRLGELYEQKGDRQKAATYYQNFVNLWKNADPDLQPQVEEIRRRLSRLTTNAGRPAPGARN